MRVRKVVVAVDAVVVPAVSGSWLIIHSNLPAEKQFVLLHQ